MAPVLQELAEQLDKEFDVVKIDIEATPENSQLAQQHGVQGIPNMQLYRDGKVVETIIGMTPKPELEVTIKKHFQKN